MKVNECNGCGYCCMSVPCDVSRRLYQSADICPQLQWDKDKNRYLCGLMLLPGQLGIEYKKELHAGAGCCSSLNDWRKDVKERTRGSLSYKYQAVPIVFQVFLKAYGSEPFLSGITTEMILLRFADELKGINYSDGEVEHIIKSTIHYINSNNSSMFKGFMS